jgi:hypothetical protein
MARMERRIVSVDLEPFISWLRAALNVTSD